MDNLNLSLLAQLVNSLRENTALLENAYKSQDKENFDNAKANLLDLQKKINLVIQKSLK